MALFCPSLCQMHKALPKKVIASGIPLERPLAAPGMLPERWKNYLQFGSTARQKDIETQQTLDVQYTLNNDAGNDRSCQTTPCYSGKPPDAAPSRRGAQRLR